MALKIEILLPDDNVSRSSLDHHMEALGFARGAKCEPVIYAEAKPGLTPVEQSIKDGTFSVRSATDDERAAVGSETPKRERGKPAPGRARRTKEEIAEDEAADAAEAAQTAQISANPENRVGPEDDAETQAQDAADEQAEVDANRDAEAPLTIEDLKMAMSEYVTKFDMGAAQEDGVNIFGDALGKPPGGEQFWKMSIAAAAGQETLKKAIAAWKAAAAVDKRYVKVG